MESISFVEKYENYDITVTSAGVYKINKYMLPPKDVAFISLEDAKEFIDDMVFYDAEQASYDNAEEGFPYRTQREE